MLAILSRFYIIPTFLKALVNQAAYSFSKTEVMAPFRCLLKKNSKFVWNEHMETAFRKAKEQIAKEITKGIKIFERNRTTCLATDWSKSGFYKNTVSATAKNRSAAPTDGK